MLFIGLIPSRQRPNPLVLTKVVHRCGLTCNGMPLADVTESFLASAPISSPRSADPHCQLFDALFPRRT